MASKLDKEYSWYQSHKSDLLARYSGKYVAIKGSQLITSAGTKEQAVKEMMDKGYKLGEFLVHFVSKDSDAVQRYYSRIY